jgi:hypothetical protein
LKTQRPSYFNRTVETSSLITRLRLEGKRGRGAEGQRGRGAGGQRGRGAEGQGGRGAEGQRGKGAEGQRGRGAKKSLTQDLFLTQIQNSKLLKFPPELKTQNLKLKTP